MTALQRCTTLGILLGAFLVRLWALDFKPTHFDEGINGHFVDQMRTMGCYVYNPENFHGPLHFYVLFVGQTLFGHNRWVLRLPTVLIGTGTIYLVLALRRFFTFRTVAIAASLLAVSPAMVFYSRYAIHEMWMPFFTLLSVYGAFGLVSEECSKRDLWALGLGITGMILTKETWAIHAIAAGLATAVVFVLRTPHPMPATTTRRRPRPADLYLGSAPLAAPPRRLAGPLTRRDCLQVSVVCLGLVVAFYSGFGMAWSGVAGLWETFDHMRVKGEQGEGHSKEPFYWLKLMAYYEWPALAGLGASFFLLFSRSLLSLFLGIVAIVAGLTALAFDHFMSPESDWNSPLWEGRVDSLAPHLGLHIGGFLGFLLILGGTGWLLGKKAPDFRVRWVALFGLATFCAYSLIPYKTPWCIVNFLWPMALVGGYVLDRLCAATYPAAVATVGLLLGGPSAVDMWRLNFVQPTMDHDGWLANGKADHERYAYVQTTFDVEKLLRPVRALIQQHVTERQMRGLVFSECYPLIWELNDLPNLHFIDAEGRSQSYDADFLIVPESRAEEIEFELHDIYYRESYLPRYGASACVLYLRAERFAKVLPPSRTPEFHPRIAQTEDLPNEPAKSETPQASLEKKP